MTPTALAAGAALELRRRQQARQTQGPTPPQMTLAQFVEQAWDVVEPEPYVEGWHIHAICNHLDAVTHRIIRNLLINVPPRSSKSLITAVFWPAWVWSWWSTASFMFVSYSAALSMRDSVKCRDLVRSHWYQQRFHPDWTLKDDQNLKSRFVNTRGGERVATSVGASATGLGASFVIAEDLHSVDEDLSETRADLETAVNFWRVVMPSRVTNPKQACFVVVGQRVADDDISGVLLQQGTYEYLCIPMEYEPPGPGVPVSQTVLGWVDPRTTPGEPMCPARYGPEELAPLKLSLGHRWHAQFQQRPTADADALFKREDWRYYHTMPKLDFFDLVVASWDFSVKDASTSSYVAGHLWGQKGVQVALLDRIWQRMDFPTSLQAIRDWHVKWPGTHAVLIEDKANGSPIFQMVRGEIPRVIPVNPQGEGSKLVRLRAVAPIQRAHNAYLPSPELAAWSNEFVENCVRQQSDDCDAMSQALSRISMPDPAIDAARVEALKKRELQRKMHEAIRRDQRGVSRSHV